MSNVEKDKSEKLSPLVNWLILGTAALGFAFDIYELLMWPLVGPPAIAHFENKVLGTPEGMKTVAYWMGISQYLPAVCGGVFGLLGGWLTDRFGRRTVLTYSILLYAGATFAGGFAPNLWFLIVCRCFAFVGVCVEFVAAVAWLAELYSDPVEKERAIGFTQAFSSIGGLLVTVMYGGILMLTEYYPETFARTDAWRYLLMSGLIPAIPLIVVRPFLPESPSWEQKSAEGTLKRPSILELFEPALLRTTIVSTIMFACSYGIAFGAIQQLTQIVPAHKEVKEVLSKIKNPEERYTEQQHYVKDVQLWQETGGLLGRFALAAVVMYLGSTPMVVRMFQVPALIVVPLCFYFIPTNSLQYLEWMIAIVGFFVVAQFSFWGNYLPRVYPLHLRGTGESFAANIGGRMIGTMAALATSSLFGFLNPIATNVAAGAPPPPPAVPLAHCAAYVGTAICVIGLIASLWLPSPEEDVDAKEDKKPGG